MENKLIRVDEGGHSPTIGEKFILRFPFIVEPVVIDAIIRKVRQEYGQVYTAPHWRGYEDGNTSVLLILTTWDYYRMVDILAKLFPDFAVVVMNTLQHQMYGREPRCKIS